MISTTVFISLILMFWIPDQIPLEMENFTKIIRSKYEMRASSGIISKNPTVEKLLLEEKIFVLSGCNLIFFRRSNILPVLGTALTYGLLFMGFEGDSIPVRQICRGCRLLKDDSGSHSIAESEMPSTRTTVKRSKEKEQKQQRVSETEIILVTSFTLVKGYMLQKVLEISTRSKHTRFTAALHGIPNILEPR
ncbi:hypothetical protein AVEN_24532-1 [Araneus ventricosus]|uniref:Uncharacterized protein n=1 Tax=Araneus ventricosus TaxID=182803 RepID=A0A4Y2F8M5_ARAVE|nr:hypothetical protein AVEN_24532-1 [Araneus ventricosus]